MSRRRRKGEEEVNLERWLVSYADFMTLLFAFFVVMYAISSVNNGKHRILSDSLSDSFKLKESSQNVIDFQSELTEQFIPNSESLIELPVPSEENFDSAKEQAEKDQTKKDQSEQDNPTLTEISKEVSSAVQDLMNEGLINLNQNENWLEIEIKSSILFESGGSILSEDAEDILVKLANIIKVYPNQLQIEGYTDNVPINTPRFPSNWELSSSRAASVVHLFEEDGVNPENMQAIGFGEHRPKASNDDEVGRTENRRVAIVILGSENSKKVTQVKPDGTKKLNEVEKFSNKQAKTAPLIEL